jgi:hypothetical protein
VGRRIALTPETSHAIDALARETGRSLDELTDEALGDLLKKYRRPRSLLEALRESARQHPANDSDPPHTKRRRS